VVLARAQVAIEGLDDARAVAKAKADDADAQGVLLEQLLAACRAVARELTYDRCAAELDAVWGERGRTVSAAVLRAALTGTERNYFRVEWLFWFAQQSPDVATLVLEIAGRGLPKKKPEDELRDLQSEVRAEFPKQAERLIRKAASPR
jgi:hypothetical protein